MWILPQERSGWADAMRNELQHLDEDGEAFRWAMGCVVTGYRERLTPTGSDKSWARWEVTRAKGRSRFIWGMCLAFSCAEFMYFSGVVYFRGPPVDDAPLYIWVLITVPPILLTLLIGYLVGVLGWSTTERGYERWQRKNRKT